MIQLFQDAYDSKTIEGWQYYFICDKVPNILKRCNVYLYFCAIKSCFDLPIDIINYIAWYFFTFTKQYNRELDIRFDGCPI